MSIEPHKYAPHPSGVHPMEIAEQMSFNLGMAWSLVSRSTAVGVRATDLMDARFYIAREIGRWAQPGFDRDRPGAYDYTPFEKWMMYEHGPERGVYQGMWTGEVLRDIGHLVKARDRLDQYLKDLEDIEHG